MAVQIGLNEKGDRIWLSGPYHQTYPSCKAIPGARWSKTEKVWTYPLSLAVCRHMRRLYGDLLEISPALNAWARGAKAQEATNKALGSATDADLKIVPEIAPHVAAAMNTRPYQKVGARFVADSRRAAVFDEPGLGKTLISLAAIMEAGKWTSGSMHLIIAPKTAIESTWPDEIEKWAPGAMIYAISEINGRDARRDFIAQAIEESKSFEGPTFVGINPNMLQVEKKPFCKQCDGFVHELAQQHGERAWFDMHYLQEHKETQKIYKMDFPELWDVVWDSIIADECHNFMLRMRPTKGDAKMPQWARGFVMLKTADDGLRIPMTGTPFRGKEENMFGIMHWVDPKAFSSFWNYVDTYLEKSSNGFGFEIGGLRADMQEEFDIMMSRFALRRTRKEVRKDLPEQVLIDHWVPLVGSHRKQYEQFATQGEVEIDNGIIHSLGVLSELTRMRQMAFGEWRLAEDGKLRPIPEKSPKIDLLLGMLEERGLTKETDMDTDSLKYIIVSQSTEILDAVQARLTKEGLSCLRITGKDKNRGETVRTFQSGSGPRILLLSTTAGGVSITLDNYCEEMFILDETWIEDDMVQVRGRIDNRGDKIATRLYHYIRTRETVEESVMKINATQADIQGALLDGRRGVELAKRLIRCEGLENA